MTQKNTPLSTIVPVKDAQEASARASGNVDREGADKGAYFFARVNALL